MAKVAGGYVGWEEVVVSSDRGRREVHYYLKDACGGVDLAVVGREKSARHMSYAVPASFLRSCGADPMSKLSPTGPSSSPSSVSCTSTITSGTTTGSCSYPSPPPSSSAASLSLKWRSRREVIDWLDSIVSGPSLYSTSLVEFWNDEGMDITDGYTLKDISSEKMRIRSEEFSWLGSSGTCRKQRKHYRSFCRNGITISVHNFVYVMSEENKRLVAYVEDLYEDLKAKKMVVVRWFHRIDEVAIILPPDVHDREIFFSLCLQDLSVECIDGLAAVLSAQHFEKHLNDAVHNLWNPFLCLRQIDNEDVKPFDITLVHGYWKQEVLRSMFVNPKVYLKSTACSRSTTIDGASDSIPNHKTKRKNRMISVENAKGSLRLKFRRVGDASLGGRHSSDCCPPAPLPPKKIPKQNIQLLLSAGCHVEVLSQDSGLRGCWFRCMILKRHQDKVKVKYQDVQDADETGHLEEWVLVSRVAVADNFGIRLEGRTTVRPQPSPRSKISRVFDVGSVVDAWWHDAWWEGIVIAREADHKVCVYFPGEQRASTFCPQDLRQSQDWSCNRWNSIRDRPDVVSYFLSKKFREDNGKDGEELGCTISEEYNHPETETPALCMPSMGKNAYNFKCGEEPRPGRWWEDVPGLAPDEFLAQLKWSSSRKRCPRRFIRGRPNHVGENDGSMNGGSHDSANGTTSCMKFLTPQPLLPDNNCKFRGDSFFSDPPAMSSLVVSR
uniref:DNA (Cytosine-5)-methyltransferase CMT2 n=2 Tax=Anthurium amnicola TaxID=1678845 RepID=A0A1D1Z8V0_9ARAE